MGCLENMIMLRAFPGFQSPLGIATPLTGVLARIRGFNTKAYDADFDPEELVEARKWRAAFTEESLPKGQTTYSRSSGPGGQHVNKSVINSSSIK